MLNDDAIKAGVLSIRPRYNLTTLPEDIQAINAISRVIFPKTAGVPAEFEQIRKIILDILPCHLEVEFYFRYLTWAECEAAAWTWQGIENARHTWESFEKAVPTV